MQIKKAFSKWIGWLICKLFKQDTVLLPPYLFCYHKKADVSNLCFKVSLYYEFGQHIAPMIWLLLFKNYDKRKQNVARLKQEMYLQTARELYVRIKTQK